MTTTKRDELAIEYADQFAGRGAYTNEFKDDVEAFKAGYDAASAETERWREIAAKMAEALTEIADYEATGSATHDASAMARTAHEARAEYEKMGEK